MSNQPPDDHIVRVLAREAGVLAMACRTDGIVLEAARRHHASPVATAALGNGLAAAALMGSLLKVQQRTAIKVEGNGPLQKMIVESDSYGRLRGYVANPEWGVPPPIGADEVAGALGRVGLLTVVKDTGIKNLYEGVVPLQTGELDKDLMYYLMQSEQVLSLLELGAEIDAGGRLTAAGGFFLQAMPGQDTAVLEQLVERTEDLPPIAGMLAAGVTPAAVLADIFGATPYELLETRSLSFHCSCSRERSLQALRLLDHDDLLTLIAEGEAIIDCHFCHERYVFDRSVLETVLSESIAQSQSSSDPATS
jgi:molecular chaperone Hsp33